MEARIRKNGKVGPCFPRPIRPTCTTEPAKGLRRAFTGGGKVLRSADRVTGKLKLHKDIQARDLWRKMLSSLFEPPPVDQPSKERLQSTQPRSKHVGRGTQLRICAPKSPLNTSADEIAVWQPGLGQPAAIVVAASWTRTKASRQPSRRAVRMPG